MICFSQQCMRARVQLQTYPMVRRAEAPEVRQIEYNPTVASALCVHAVMRYD